MNNNPSGLPGDIKRLRENSAATAAELREFMQRIKGKSPQEMLGAVAQSSLVQATGLATVLCVVFMVVFTVGPYLINKNFPASAPVVAQGGANPQGSAGNAEKPAGGAGTQGSDGENKPGAATTQNSGSKPQAVTIPDDPSPKTKPKVDDDLLNKLGVGETKGFDADKNPLDKKDDLLKFKD